MYVYLSVFFALSVCVAGWKAQLVFSEAAWLVGGLVARANRAGY